MTELLKLTTKAKLTEFGVSMPLQLVKRLDDARGDIPRSKFLLRLVERELKEQEEKLQKGTQVGSHRCPAAVVEATTNPVEGGGSH
jgi:metal-responsive CopG/Arc/MetJ family transcriptional regulator